jgi:hypothetical protein
MRGQVPLMVVGVDAFKDVAFGWFRGASDFSLQERSIACTGSQGIRIGQ